MNAAHTLETSVQYVPGIGPQRARSLARLNIRTIADLMHYFPVRYEDRSTFSSLTECVPGDSVTIQGTIIAKHIKRMRTISFFECLIETENAHLTCVFFNQLYLTNSFTCGDRIIVYGKLESYHNKLQMNSPEYEIMDSHEGIPLHTGRIVPIYGLTEGISQKVLRTAQWKLQEIGPALLNENLPARVVEHYHLISRQRAFKEIHFPNSMLSLAQAQHRLIFEELYFFLSTVSERIHTRYTLQNTYPISADPAHLANFIRPLPFELTPSQKRALEAVETDMNKPYPMNRVIQGDVGSGKTIVALWALYLAAKSGHQALFLMPTEILAEQHFIKWSWFLRQYGIPCALLTGSTPQKEKSLLITQFTQKSLTVLFGTHALLQKELKSNHVGLVVIDELHKFGVEQRAFLQHKQHSPHLLIMSATPIPRTMGLILCGESELTTITDMPPGRTSVKTTWITREKEGQLFTFIKKRLTQGQQAFIVFPVLEDTEKKDLLAAKKEFHRLQREIFPDYTVGIVYGKMKRDDKTRLMDQFLQNKINILVATSVVEVGIDFPNASCMIIMNAERFGLSQLHQLRGRVGRGKHESFCFLVGQPTTEMGKKRLRLMTKTNNGFVIAEEDMHLRGPGDFLGTNQSGLPLFKIADLVRDTEILETVKKEIFKNTNVSDAYTS